VQLLIVSTILYRSWHELSNKCLQTAEITTLSIKTPVEAFKAPVEPLGAPVEPGSGRSKQTNNIIYRVDTMKSR
jgi:hypothetical protein